MFQTSLTVYTIIWQPMDSVDKLVTSQSRSTVRFHPLSAWALLGLALLLVGLWNLEGPQLWWDEGWTLSVARHWAEDGHYGRLRNGERIAGGLQASFTTTVPVGVSMRLFGVGIWQGRLFGVLTSVGVVLLLAALAQRLYGRGAAAATTVVVLAMTMHPQIHPLLQGRQVLAEMPMLLYLLAGYLCLWWGLAGPRVALLPAALLLGTAWVSKGQTMPFLVVSLLTPLGVALLARRWATAASFALVLAGTYLTARLLPQLANTLLYDSSLPGEPIEGLLGMVAVVLTPFHRSYALRNLLVFGLPTLLGVGWSLWRLWADRSQLALANATGASWYMRLVLLSFSGSWLAWFVALSVGVPRYMATPVVVGSIFVAELLRALTMNFQLGLSLERLAGLVSLRRPSWAGGAALLALLLSLTTAVITAMVFFATYPIQNPEARQVAELLNARPAGTLIETYESELHFLLDQPYHFPPDQLHVTLGMRSLRVNEEVVIDYDPLAADPDYLVVGAFAAGNELYAPVLATDAFELMRDDGQYAIYRRVRSEPGQ